MMRIKGQQNHRKGIRRCCEGIQPFLRQSEQSVVLQAPGAEIVRVCKFRLHILQPGHLVEAVAFIKAALAGKFRGRAAKVFGAVARRFQQVAQTGRACHEIGNPHRIFAARQQKRHAALTGDHAPDGEARAD